LQDQGFCDQALAAAEQALTEARAHGHVNTLLYAHSCRLLLFLARRDHAAIATCTRDMGRLARQHGAHSYQLEMACLEHVLALRQACENTASLIAIQRTLVELQAINWIYLVTRLSLYAAEVAAEAGHAGHARRWYEAAQSLVERLEQRGCLPELHRVGAAVLRAEGSRPAEVEALLGLALTAARAQGARWLELRASYALAHHLCAMNRSAEAADILAKALQTCPEAAGTPAFSAAYALLDSQVATP
jgi:hypothetical protein